MLGGRVGHRTLPEVDDCQPVMAHEGGGISEWSIHVRSKPPFGLARPELLPRRQRPDCPVTGQASPPAFLGGRWQPVRMLRLATRSVRLVVVPLLLAGVAAGPSPALPAIAARTRSVPGDQAASFAVRGALKGVAATS